MQINRKQSLFLLTTLLLLAFGQITQVNAQDSSSRWFVDNPRPLVINWDTNYIRSFQEDLTTRLYTSVKYTAFRIANKEEMQNLFYLTNRNIILGVGATYSWFTLNIGLSFPFINHDDVLYGNTSYLDLQTHIYLRKYNADLYLQLYKGYYLANSGNVIRDWPQGDTFQLRPDIRTINMGFNFQHFFNYRKYSFKAAFNQTEWQKKTAGSWVLGINFFYSINGSDSASLIPGNLQNPYLFNGIQFNRQDVLNIGINGGYYFTLVVARHFFFSVGLAVGPGIGFSWLDIRDKSIISRSGMNPVYSGVFRSSLGYNSERVFVGLSFLQQMVFNQLPSQNIWNYFNTGNIRFFLVYRFKLKQPIRTANPRYWKILNNTE